MRAVAGWALVALLFTAVAWAKAAPPPAAAAPTGLAALERNIALGSALAKRQGTEAEFAEVQKLTERGIASAWEAAQKDPKSAEAQYLLGSWLLYGYRVVKADRITYDAQGVEHQDKVSRVVQGTSEAADEGLEALRKACELAPQRGKYLVDYGAALCDYEAPLLAAAALKKVWGGDVQVAAEDKIRAALLMSDIDAGSDDVAGARGWLYRALLENRAYAGVVTRLRSLDVLQAKAAAAAAKAAATAAQEPATSEEPGEEAAPPAAEPTGGESVEPEAGAAAEENSVAPSAEQAPPAQDEVSPETSGSGGASEDQPAESEATDQGGDSSTQ